MGDYSNDSKEKTSNFTVGQDLLCKVLAKETGGYRVRVEANERIGFISTNMKLNIGEMIVAKYVGESDARIQLSLVQLGPFSLGDS